MMPIHSSPTQPASPASDQSAAHDLPPLEEEPRLQYGASRKLNRKAILFLAALGVMGMGLLAWGFSQFSLFGKREPAKAATERVVIPDDPPMPPVPVAPASAALTGAAGGMSPRGQETAPLPETPQPGQAIALAAPGGSAAPAQGGRARGAGQGAVAPWAAQAGNPGTAAHGEGDALSRQRAGSSGLVMNAASPADDRNAFQVARGSVSRLAHADYLLTRGTYIRCVLETRATGRPPIAVNAEAEKVKDAFNAAIEKLRRAVETDLGKLKDKNLRESVRGVDDSSTPADAAVA